MWWGFVRDSFCVVGVPTPKYELSHLYEAKIKNTGTTNPLNGGEEVTHRSPQAIMEEIAALDAESRLASWGSARAPRAVFGASPETSWFLREATFFEE